MTRLINMLIQCITNGTKTINSYRERTERQTTRDTRTRGTTKGEKAGIQETVSTRRGSKGTSRVRESIRQCKRRILQSKRCKTYLKERFAVTSVLPLYFSQYIPLLSTITIDDYIMYDKLQLILGCYINQDVMTCARGIGL
jgi:hypothetical protein